MLALKNLLRLGIPPFVTWSGPPKSEEPEIIKYGHPSAPLDPEAAIEKIADLSEYGEFARGQRIVDSEGKVLLDTHNPQHIEMLKSLRRERDSRG